MPLGVPELLSGSWGHATFEVQKVWGGGIYVKETHRRITIVIFIIYTPGPVLNFAMMDLLMRCSVQLSTLGGHVNIQK